MRGVHLFFSIFFSLSLLPYSQSQAPNTTGYACDARAAASTYPCKAYAFYRATAPNFLDLASIGDLFGVSRLMIASPSNITSSPSSSLAPNQSLLVPISCSCSAVNTTTTMATTNNLTTSSLSYAALNYTIKPNDTYYLVSTNSFLNLTTYQSVEVVNPDLVPTNLSIGVNVVFPIFCKCPNRTQSNRTNFLISYVYQPSDSFSSVASFFGSDVQSIIDVNGAQIQPFDTIFVPVNRLPQLSQPTASPPAPAPTTVVVGPPGRVERKGVIIGLGIGLGICGILLILICGLWVYRESLMRERREREGYEEEKEKEKAAAVGGNFREGVKLEGMAGLGISVSECLDKYRVYEIEELRDATGGFDERWLIQGSVYRGCINEEVYAIKKMKWNACEELKILQKVSENFITIMEIIFPYSIFYFSFSNKLWLNPIS